MHGLKKPVFQIFPVTVNYIGNIFSRWELTHNNRNDSHRVTVDEKNLFLKK